MLHRLTQDFGELKEGSRISEGKFNFVYYLDRPLFEPILDFEIQDMIEWNDTDYCVDNNIECMLFYTQNELENFLKKI